MKLNESNPKIIYYENELEDEFSTAEITPRLIDGKYNYEGGFWRKIGRGVFYHFIAKIFLFIFLKLKYGHKIVNKKCLKKAKATGYFLYGNHTNPMADAFIPTRICNPVGAYIIVHPNNVSMPVLGKITPCLGAIPLPDDKEALKNFTNCIEHLICKKKRIVIYPEAHIWPYYTGIRNFTDSSFRYPAKLNVPVFSFTNTYQKRKLRKTPKMITYIDGPFYGNNDGTLKERKKELHEKVLSSMKQYCKNSNVELIKYIKKEV